MTTDENRATETGVIYAEDEAGSTVRLKLQRSRLYPTRFATMFDATFSTMAGMDRPPCYYRTLFQCLQLLDPIQSRRVSAREIAEASGQSHISAQRALAMLQADRAIIGTGQASAKSYRLNNRLCSMSSAERWNQETPDMEIIDSRGRA